MKTTLKTDITVRDICEGFVYNGVMGVPITFLDKYNPEQFEIIGQTRSSDKSPEVEKIRKDPIHRPSGILLGTDKELYARILIRRKKE